MQLRHREVRLGRPATYREEEEIRNFRQFAQRLAQQLESLSSGSDGVGDEQHHQALTRDSQGLPGRRPVAWRKLLGVHAVGNHGDRKSRPEEGAVGDLLRHPPARRDEVQSIRRQSREQLFLPKPDAARQVVIVAGPELGTGPATCRVSAATRVVMTAARERVHVAQRPDDGHSRRNGSEETAVIDEARDPLQVDDIEAVQTVTVLPVPPAPIVGELLRPARPPALVGLEVPFQVAAPEARAQLRHRIARSAVLRHGWIVRIATTDQHPAVVPAVEQPAMEAVGRPSGPAGRVERTDL